MSASTGSTQSYDVFVIGGGVNGTGIARDAAGRGYSVMLAEMNDLFANMLDNGHVMMAYLDRDFRFQFVNEAYAATGHRPAETFIGQSHFAFYPDADNERIFGEVLATGKPFRADAKPFKHPDQASRGTTY